MYLVVKLFFRLDFHNGSSLFCFWLFKSLRMGCGIGFYRFPSDKKRLISWIKAVSRENLMPGKDARICGAHFQTGMPSRDADHPDYVPNVFSFKKGRKTASVKCHKRRKALQIKRSEVLKEDDEIELVEPIICKHDSGMSFL
ncbi:peroxynitrite isomerase THAP4 [Parasteatoda tepidariorum]|uniref:peroxynitrite isomerase THAP4 n=1 Tax=Parasteatoda tepidariorum TaxID=114398 RepID=UPI0039BD9091